MKSYGITFDNAYIKREDLVMKRKVKTISLMCLMLTIFFNATVYGWAYYKKGHCSPQFSIKNRLEYYGRYDNAFSNAVSSWNNLRPQIKIEVNSNSENYIKDSYYFDSSYGYYLGTEFNSDGQATKFEIVLNNNLLKEDTSDLSDSNKSRFYQSTIAHELGHALCLDHTTCGEYLMSTDRTRYKTYKPTTDEKNGIDNIWDQEIWN